MISRMISELPARIDSGDARVRVHAANRVLVHVTVATVKLQTCVGHTKLQLTREQLGLRRIIGRQLARIVPRNTLVYVGLGNVDLGSNTSHLKPGILKIGDRLAEYLAFTNIIHRHVVSCLTASEKTDRTEQTLLGEPVH